MDDNQYVAVSKRRTKALAFSMRQTEEVVGANILNRAFNSSYTGGDGKELIATDHPTVSGTQSNELAVAADLSEASIEDIGIQIMETKNSRGHRIAIMPRALVIPPSLAFDAERIVRSVKQSGTANNDLNAIKSMGLFPDGVVINHYLTDADAWFVKTNAPNGLTRFTRKATAFGKDNDFDTENVKAKATMRFSVGWSEWRGMFGSAGA
jgi:phage major head subunit gpT-like protein